MKPSVTVLIRTFNSESTLDVALESAVGQTLDPSMYSIIVVDDGSIDASLSIARRYKGITVLESHHRGAVGVLNWSLRHVTTPLVILLDSDDWFEPTILESMYGLFSEDPTTDFVYSDYYEIVDGSRAVVSVGENIFNTIAAGIMFSIESIKSHGFYDESLIFPEYDLLIRMLPSAKRWHIPKPLYNYVRHRGSITSDKAKVKTGKRQLFERHGHHYPIRDF